MIDRETLLRAFNFRHACKEFDPERRIPAEDFQAILECGRLSPSSFGFEPWRFLVLQDPARREALRAITWGGQKQLPTASHVVLILVRKDGMRFDSEHVAHMMRDIQQLPEERIGLKREKYRVFQETDFRLLESERALLDWAGKQAYIALGNMMTGAALLGIDSCPIEGYTQDDVEALLAEQGLLDRRHWGLAVMVAFGYRMNPQSAKTRQPMADVVRWID